MNDIQIGEKSTLNSAIAFNHYLSDIGKNTDLSENSQEYWCTSHLLGVSIHINKETPEAEKLKFLIGTGSAKRVNNFLDTLAIKHLKVQDFKNKIIEVKRDSFDRGVEFAQVNFRSAIGM